MQNRTYGVAVPDVYEVESVVLLPPAIGGSAAGTTRGSAMQSKLQQLKERGLEQWHQLQHSMAERSEDGLERINDLRRTISDRAGLMRRQGMDKWRDVERTVSDRTVAMKSSVVEKIEEIEHLARDKAAALKSDMKTNAPKWAGIAAGAGLVLGIGGRVMRHRMRHQRERYAGLVIIEGAC